MDSKMEIRRLAPADAELYRTLMLEAYRRHPEAFTTGPDERIELPLAWWEQRLAEGTDSPCVVIGAFADGKLAAVAGLDFGRREKTRHKATLFGMYVDPDYRRHGVGEALVGAVMGYAAARSHIELIQLTVSESNQAARKLYLRCGFEEFGIEPYALKLAGGYVGKVHMWRQLHGAESKA